MQDQHLEWVLQEITAGQESQILRKEMLPSFTLLTAMTDLSNKGEKILSLTFDRLIIKSTGEVTLNGNSWVRELGE